jgi:hypothetical protein
MQVNHQYAADRDIIDRRGNPVLPGRLGRHGKWRDG